SLLAQTTHSNTHVHLGWVLCFFPSWTVLPPGPQEQWVALMAPGDQVKLTVHLGQGRTGKCSVLLHIFLLGFLVEETPCEHGENMQTPHRKAREIAHLSTEGLGRTCPPEPIFSLDVVV